jgi:hypothetical protein
MDDLMNNGTIPFIFFGLIVLLVIWQAGAHMRARATVTRETEYRALADRAVKAQEIAEHRMAGVSDQFVELNRRLSVIERVLKDAE